MELHRKIFLVLMVLWMVMIFLFSSRSGELSAEDSTHAGMLVGEMFVPGFEQWSEQEQLEFAQRIDHPVRKTAHAAEYALLALLAAGVLIRKETTLGAGIVFPLAVTAAYAATDEIHQLFVAGRSGQISDVLLDSAGALAGLLFLAGVRACLRTRKKSTS